MNEQANMAAHYEHEIPEGYEARIEGNKVIIELKESEDERIRKNLIELLLDTPAQDIISHNLELSKILAYLEKQKEQKPVVTHGETYHVDTLGTQQVIAGKMPQKPAEWSEEFLRLMGITISQDGNQVCVLLGENLAEGIAGFGDTLDDAVEEFKKEWRQFDRFRKATWKPSKEQMKALNEVIGDERMEDTAACEKKAEILELLYNDLKKL